MHLQRNMNAKMKTTEIYEKKKIAVYVIISMQRCVWLARQLKEERLHALWSLQ